jgi:hypothetical protein
MMNHKISHSRADETLEAKALWFRSLSLEDRMDVFVAFTDLALELNPKLPDKKDAEQAQRRIRIISKA